MPMTKKSAHMREIQNEPIASTGNAGATTHKVFVVVLMVVLIVPFVCMPFVHEDAASEKRELAEEPQLMIDGQFNLGFLSDAGTYFLDHFAFRSKMVDADATIKQNLFMSSSTQNVVVGANGWLYYAGTLNDYQRKNSMSDHALRNAAFNLALMQEYFSGMGKRFVVAIAPNKNELYPQNMPYYELAGEGASNTSRLNALLDEAGVNYVDLHRAFAGEGDVLYFARDSHWNDMGALVAYEGIMRSLGKEPVAFADGPIEQEHHRGDVDGMLHPDSLQGEAQQHATGVDAFEYVGDARDVEENYLITQATGPTTNDSLIMYRDSFGNNLLPPFAATYRQAVFTKLVPYDMSERMCAFATDVVIERTERHLAFFATSAPYLPAPIRKDIEQSASIETQTSKLVRINGPYLVVEGTLDQAVAGEKDRVYVQIAAADGASTTYEAFHVSEQQQESLDSEDSGQTEASNDAIRGDWGYRAHIPWDGADLPALDTIKIIISNENTTIEVG